MFLQAYIKALDFIQFKSLTLNFVLLDLQNTFLTFKQNIYLPIDNEIELVILTWQAYDNFIGLFTDVQFAFAAVWLSICTRCAKCKFLFATLTHLQSNSSSVVYELASSFYGSY